MYILELNIDYICNNYCLTISIVICCPRDLCVYYNSYIVIEHTRLGLRFFCILKVSLSLYKIRNNLSNVNFSFKIVSCQKTKHLMNR